MPAQLRLAPWFARLAGARPSRSRPRSSRVHGTQPATISNLASAHFPGRATSSRHCARDDRTSRNRCNCQCAPAVSWSHSFVHERPALAALHCRGESTFWTRAGVEALHALCATLDDQARGMHSTNLLKRLFAPEIPVSENARALRGQKDRQSNRRWRLRRAVCLLLAEKYRKAGSPVENANQVRPR